MTVGACRASAELTESDLERMRRTGFLVREGYWAPGVCDAVAGLVGSRCSPTAPWDDFPHPPAAELLNRLPVEPNLLWFAERFLGTPEMYLAGSQFQLRTAGDALDRDQPLHLDEGTNTLLVQPLEPRFGYLVAFTYWTDVSEDCGPLRRVESLAELEAEVRRDPRTTFPDGDPATWFPDDYPWPAAGERTVSGPKGTLILYTLNWVHAGSRMRRPEARRIASWFTYRPHEAPWAGQDFWGGRAAWRPDTVGVVERFSPRERHLLGVPLPGHPFWSEDTIRRVHRRYPNMDMAPYRAALAGGGGGARAHERGGP